MMNKKEKMVVLVNEINATDKSIENINERFESIRKIYQESVDKLIHNRYENYNKLNELRGYNEKFVWCEKCNHKHYKMEGVNSQMHKAKIIPNICLLDSDHCWRYGEWKRGNVEKRYGEIHLILLSWEEDYWVGLDECTVAECIVCKKRKLIWCDYMNNELNSTNAYDKLKHGRKMGYNDKELDGIAKILQRVIDGGLDYLKKEFGIEYIRNNNQEYILTSLNKELRQYTRINEYLFKKI